MKRNWKEPFEEGPGSPPDLEARAEAAKEAALVIDPALKDDDEKKKDQPLASVKQVFSFGAGRKKRVYLVLGLMCAFVSGCIFPLMAFLFARSFESLGAYTSGEDFMEEIRKNSYYFMGLGAAAFVFMSGQATFLESVAGLMALDFKTKWFDALLRQDMAYFDIKDTSGSATIISANGAKYKKGLGRKLGAGLQFFVTFLGGLVYAFYASWRISLIVLATVPCLVGSTLFLLKTNQTQSARASEGYAEAGSIVQTTVACIRTILSLNAVKSVIDKYSAATEKSYRQSVQLLHRLGAANGVMMASMVLGYVVVTLYGAFLLFDSVTKDGCDPSGTIPNNNTCDPSGADVFGSLMGITFAATVLPQVQVGVEAFTDARAACYPAIQVINRKVGDDESSSSSVHARRSSETPLPKYEIDSSSDKGLKLPYVLGNIEFNNVKFAYPTRQETNVFDGFSLFVEAGTTVALVGPSGCGKSTVVSLLERFYDVLGGSVKLDFHDIRQLNVHWLREQIGLVGQEPALFACSIRENIAYGNPNATQEDIKQAARMANAHDFIESFPNGYDTQVGDKGAQMSGGQKQRIAIARVLVKNPKILLLDESTSALDTESERIVQEALDSVVAEQRRTTLVVAHRLSTIKSADMIAVVEEGRIVEAGNHEELMALQGHYYKLVEAQNLRQAAEGSSHSRPSSEAPSRNSSFVDLRASVALRSAPAIAFRDVHFHYPSRPDIDVFRGLDLNVYPGESLALVGPSGHGKSTTIQLIERFYDPASGVVELDGVDMKETNVAWLREQFGLVGQEPVLFDTSIKENIRLSYPDATMEDIVDAAKQANAHDFIESFPDGYDTQCGEGGTQVSGGQKQRIAIARALLRKPRFLLLDEATSALDSKSEEVVQETLDKIMTSKSLTTIMIAHRLSSVSKCDRIALIADGKVRELGTHDELMSIPDGRYRRMQAFQSLEGAEALAAPLRARSKEDTANLKRSDENEDEGEGDEKLNKEKEKSNAKRARLLAKEDHHLFAIGGFGALLTGFTFPAWGICFAFMIDLLYQPVPLCNEINGTDSIIYPNGTEIPCDAIGYGDCQAMRDGVADDMWELALNILWGLLGIMVVSVLGGIALFYGFGKASERMNKRVRNAAFDSLVRQEVSFFDLHPVGVITSQLQEDAALMHSFSGEPIRTLVINLSSVLVGIAVSFAFMWPFSLLSLALIPPMGFGAEMEMKLYFGEDEGAVGDEDMNSPGGIVVETLVNIRTVASLNIEKERSAQYVKALRAEDPTPVKANFIKGCATGVGQFIQMWGMALMFWFGGWLLATYPNTYIYRDFLISLFSLLFGLEGMGFAAQGTTDREKAKKAANRIFELTDRQSAIDPLSDEGKKNV